MPDAPRLRAFVERVKQSAELTRDSLTVFVATRLVNPTNERSHWAVRARRVKVQRETAAVSVHVALSRLVTATSVYGSESDLWNTPAERPKYITFTAYVARKFDTDGLQAACKSIRDGLQDCGLIHSDGPDSGHIFEYHQLIDRTRRGVEIAIRLRDKEVR